MEHCMDDFTVVRLKDCVVALPRPDVWLADLMYHGRQFNYTAQPRQAFSLLIIISVRISDWLSGQIIWQAFLLLARQPGRLVLPLIGWVYLAKTVLLLNCLGQAVWFVNVSIPRPNRLIGCFTSTRLSDLLVYVNQAIWLAGLHRAGCLIGWFTLIRLFDSLFTLGKRADCLIG